MANGWCNLALRLGSLVLVISKKTSSLREMTIPRNDTLAAEPSTKKTVEIDRFHKLFTRS